MKHLVSDDCCYSSKNVSPFGVKDQWVHSVMLCFIQINMSLLHTAELFYQPGVKYVLGYRILSITTFCILVNFAHVIINYNDTLAIAHIFPKRITTFLSYADSTGLYKTKQILDRTPDL